MSALRNKNGVRLICVTMQSEMKTDKYNDVRTLLDDAFATYTGYTESLPGRDRRAGSGGRRQHAGHGDGYRPRRPAAAGRRPDRCGCSVSLELPERYFLGVHPAYPVYTIHGRDDKQESTSVRVPVVLTGLEELLAKSAQTPPCLPPGM